MKVYTRTGDKGSTSLIGDRRKKDDIRVEAYGTIDEANSFLQFIISKLPKELEDLREILVTISHELFDCGHDLAIVNGVRPYKVTSNLATILENLIDKYKEELDDLEYFILPGGSELSSLAHIVRTITRRAERIIVKLSQDEEINNDCLIYINRLSDFFFVFARLCNKRLSVEDAVYIRSEKVFRSNK
ncbi:cob(I)yrinic acid a,c-diamide adenosyltransferase [Mycoplasmatota bacterium WC44]